MKTVLDVIRCAEVDGDIGIEIECEGNNLKNTNDIVEIINWVTEKDGSLRGHFPYKSCEYVLAKPIKFDNVQKTLSDLVEHLKDSKLAFSYRTSVHIHLNCQSATEDVVHNIVYTYYILEQMLMDYCGEHRNGNRFCLRLSDAEAITDLVGSFYKKGLPFWKTIDENHCRYAALNLAAIRKYGSIEFRGMRGTLNLKVLNNWIGAIKYIKQYAESKKNVLEIQEDYKKLGAEGFILTVLGTLSFEFYYKGFEKDLDYGYILTLDFPEYYKTLAQARIKKESEKKEPENKMVDYFKAMDIQAVAPKQRRRPALVVEDDMPDAIEGLFNNIIQRNLNPA